MPRYYEAETIAGLIKAYTMGDEFKRMAMLESLSNSQTADVVEVKHGRWIWQGSVSEGCWICSECKHKFYQGYGNENFCPECGADMRKETEDDTRIKDFVGVL